MWKRAAETSLHYSRPYLSSLWLPEQKTGLFGVCSSLPRRRFPQVASRCTNDLLPHSDHRSSTGPQGKAGL